MELAGCFTSQLQGRTIFLLLLLLILPSLGGCIYTGHPRYQPFSSIRVQGYEDIAIDDRTYLVLYRGYHEGFFYSWDTLDEKWLQGAQEYALYRAGELAKSKDAKYFVVLYKDDWNLLSMITKGRGRSPVVHPGAGLVIRVLNAHPSSMKPNDDRVYEVDKLLQDLAQKNNGLAVNHKGTPSEKPSGNVFGRWRSSVSGYDSVPVPGHWEELSGSRGFMFESGTRTARGSNGNVQVASSHEGFFMDHAPFVAAGLCPSG